MATKGKPNQILLPNFHGYVVKHGKIHSDEENFLYSYLRMLPMPQANNWWEDQMQGQARKKKSVKEVQRYPWWVQMHVVRKAAEALCRAPIKKK